MSTYGTYINGEDPNKKDPNAVGATTPTTPTVLPYEVYVGTGTGSNAYQAGVGLIGSNYTTAVNAAETNKQLGMNYAQGVKNSAYSSAENLRQQTDANTEIARQRGIIDSNSSYQKAIGTYGANAEALGNSGLGASGYGEYLNADAYATHRGQVQSINADALKANRESAYLEAQTKAAADSEYLKNLYDINTEYNNAKSKADSEKAKELYDLGVGLDTARDEAYTSLIDAAANGTSLDIIKQSGAWGDLTPEQQGAIISESNKVTNTNAVQDMIDSGASAEEIKGSEEYSKLDTSTKAKVDDAIEQRDESIDNVVAAIVQTAIDNEHDTLDELNAFLNTYGIEEGNLLPTNIKNAVVEKWTNQNVEESIKVIKNAKAGDGELVDDEGGIAEDIAAGIKNGWYGDRTQEVIDQYIDALIEKAPPRGDNRTNFFIGAYDKLKKLGFEKESLKELEEILRTIGIFDVVFE